VNIPNIIAVELFNSSEQGAGIGGISVKGTCCVVVLYTFKLERTTAC